MFPPPVRSGGTIINPPAAGLNVTIHFVTRAGRSALVTPPSTKPPAPQPAATGRTGYAAAKPAGRSNGNGGNGRRTTATEAQQRAIFAICKSLNLDMATVLADYNVTDAGQLSVKDASRLIDDLKARQADISPARGVLGGLRRRCRIH